MTKLCPDTIRACIEALPASAEIIPEREMVMSTIYHTMAKKALVALLPDPAEELVEQWTATEEYAYGDQSTSAFARWLISSGKMKGE